VIVFWSVSPVSAPFKKVQAWAFRVAFPPANLPPLGASSGRRDYMRADVPALEDLRRARRYLDRRV
jgi:hypothetical protein